MCPVNTLLVLFIDYVTDVSHRRDSLGVTDNRITQNQQQLGAMSSLIARIKTSFWKMRYQNKSVSVVIIIIHSKFIRKGIHFRYISLRQDVRFSAKK